MAISGCDTLDERVLDESLEGAGRAETVEGSIAPAYGQVGWVWRHTNYFGLQQVASDQAILPFRGGVDWFDGGKFIAVHQHLMTPTNVLVTDPWNEITRNISRTVTAMENLRPLAEDGNAEAEEALREMIALRAYLNMLLLDSWGLVFEKEGLDERSQILRGQEAIDYVRSELESVVDVIGADKGPGRLTQGAVWGLLARLHLNAAVYRNPYGTPDFSTDDMDKVIEYSDKIINSGNYSLSSEYFDLFKDGNINNPELIFAVDQRGVLENEHIRWAYWSLPGGLRPRPEHPEADGTDGPALTPDWARTWEDEYGSFEAAEQDPRFYMEETPVPDSLQDLSGVSPGNDEDHYFCVENTEFEVDKGILRGVVWGPREGPDGNFLTCEDGRVRIYPIIQESGKDAGQVYIDLTLEVNFTNEGRLHRKGYRFSKHQCSHTSPDCNNFSSVSLVLLRLGEVYLNRAEAKLRKGNVAGALEDVNTLRTARDARPDQTLSELTSIDLDRLYRERGFELYWEAGHGRRDQIRFGTYEDSWTEKTDSDVNKRLFPIPQSTIDGASSVEGFLTQNRGY